MVSGSERDPVIRGLGLPVILVVASLFVLMAFETSEAIHDRGALADLRLSQEPTVQEAIKVRQQLELLAAGKTARLAADDDDGDGAKTIVDQMKR